MTSIDSGVADAGDKAGAVGAERAIAAGVTAMAVALHVRFLLCAGPLWRDEVTTVTVANLPTVSDYLREHLNDSFPAIWHLVLRCWQRVGPGPTDPALRALGLGVGLLTLAALWRNARALGARSPVASLLLLGLSPTAICYGDSLRAYGAGMLTGLLSMAAIFGVTQAVGRRQARLAVAGALVASLVSVHTSFLNAMWLLAICVAAAALCLRVGRRRRAAAVLGVGAVCAASLLVYIPMLRERALVAPMLVYPTSPRRVWAVLSEALADAPLGGRGGRDTVWMCVIAAAALLAVAALRAARRATWAGPPVGRQRQSDAAAFCLLTLIVGIPAYFGFMVALRYAMQPFYFLSLMAMAAACVDGLLAGGLRSTARVPVAACFCLIGIVAFPAAWVVAGMRMSNVDLAAAYLTRSVAPGDVVVVTPFWLSSSLVRYYRGQADVQTVPPVPELRYHQLLPFFRQLHDPHALDPLLSRLEQAARTGHRVWVVQMSWEPVNWNPDAPLREPPPTVWTDAEFYRYWNLQVGRTLRRAFNVTSATPVSLDEEQPVNPFEEIQVVRVGP